MRIALTAFFSRLSTFLTGLRTASQLRLMGPVVHSRTMARGYTASTVRFSRVSSQLWSTGQGRTGFIIMCLGNYITTKLSSNTDKLSSNTDNMRHWAQTWKKLQAVQAVQAALADILSEITLFWGHFEEEEELTKENWGWIKEIWGRRIENEGLRIQHWGWGAMGCG